jgi:hypothetical protein
MPTGARPAQRACLPGLRKQHRHLAIAVGPRSYGLPTVMNYGVMYEYRRRS